MKNLIKLLLVLVCSSYIPKEIKAQSSLDWTSTHITSFNQLKAKSFVFLHPSFINKNIQNAQHLNAADFPSSIEIYEQKEHLKFKTYLAEDNPMLWSFKIINDTTAEWYDLSCECNVGLESAIFGNKPNPYKKKIATLTLQKDGLISVVYTEQFQKEILDKTSFSNAFFKNEYIIYSAKN